MSDVLTVLQSHEPTGDWESAQFYGCSCGLWNGFSSEGWSTHIAASIAEFTVVNPSVDIEPGEGAALRLAIPPSVERE